jgi:hypothetical protein
MNEPSEWRLQQTSRFPAIPLTKPIAWAANAVPVPLWLHHFLSLRWIFDASSTARTETDRVRTAVDIVNDFLVYHQDPVNVVSQYYLGRVADHTCADRLDTFSKVLRLAEAERLTDRLERYRLRVEIERLLRFLSTDFAYRPQTNHGLMIDVSMLRFCTSHPQFDRHQRITRHVEARAIEQLEAIFGPDNVMREHSVGYQEYDLGILAGAVASLAEVREGVERAESVLRGGVGFLSRALKPNGQYAALGDSIRRPTQAVIQLLLPYAREEDASELQAMARREPIVQRRSDLHVYWDSGFAFIRNGVDDTREARDLHLAFTCSRHSLIHKHQDDTAFTVFANGCDLLDDPGYQDALSDFAEHRKTMVSARRHSVVTADELDWDAIVEGSRIVAAVCGNEVRGVMGEHRCIPQAVIRRYAMVVAEANVLIFDRITSAVSRRFRQNFVLGPEVEPEVCSDGIVLRRKANSETLARLKLLGNGEAQVLTSTHEMYGELHDHHSSHCSFGTEGTDVRFATVLEVEAHGDVARVQAVEEIAAGLLRITLTQGEQQRVLTASFLDQEGNLLARPSTEVAGT